MYLLELEIHSYWRAGTGRGEGVLLDEKCHRDTQQLPCLPGRSIKGLLRDAVWRLEQWEHLPEGKTDSLFGTRTKNREEINAEEDFSELNKNVSIPGRVRVSNAQLNDDLRNYLVWLRKNQRQNFYELTDYFFKDIHATALEKGVAKKTSLRVMEVVIPMNLYARLSIQNGTEDDIEAIKQALPLIRAVGTGRNRGLGRATVTLKILQSKEVSHAQ